MLTALEEYLECYRPMLKWQKRGDAIVVDLPRGKTVIFCTTDGSRVFYHIDVFWDGAYSEDSCIVSSFDEVNNLLYRYRY